MSIDYSNMEFPKPQKKKKKKIHKKSILRTEKGTCYLCAYLNSDYSHKYTEEHHVLFGSGLRQDSEREGLKVNLCLNHHRIGKEAVHNNIITREKLCQIAQEEYEKNHTREEWMEFSKKNYKEDWNGNS